MSLDQHTSVQGALTLAPQFFFMAIGETDELSGNMENIGHVMSRYQHYVSRASEILDKPRTGWTRERRMILQEYWESIGAHMLKVAIAAAKVIDGLVKWHIRRGENPPQELMDIFSNIESRMRLIRKGFFHDFQEWGKNPDITPGEKTREEQDAIEYNALVEYAKLYGDDFPLRMYLSMQNKTLENEIIFNLDKQDATIMALNYDRDMPGCDVSEFFPYTFGKLTLPMMGEILQTLIDHKKDYPSDFFIQYDSLLFHGGDIDRWRHEMDLRATHGPAWELYARLKRLKKKWGEL